jgi:hypothetical protein
MRFSLFGIALWTVLVGVAVGDPVKKKLIEYGWDEPDVAYLREHAEEMQKRPLDGVIFVLRNVSRDGKKKGDFTWSAWGSKVLEDWQYQESLEDLKATKFTRFTDNFVRLNVTPGDVDWFDDAGFASVMENIRRAARVAKKAGVKGILFDTEAYNTTLWNYGKTKQAATKSWDDYAAACRSRGKDFINAIQKEYPDCTIFMTFAYTLSFDECGGDKAKLPKSPNGLLVPFLDGALGAAGDQIRFVDGQEGSYSFKVPSEFEGAYNKMKTAVLPFVSDQQKYAKHYGFGFGIWMDYDWRGKGWDVHDLKKNFFTPESFEQSVTAALRRSDEYVWIYTETPKWWAGDKAATDKLPAAYEKALARARANGST